MKYKAEQFLRSFFHNSKEIRWFPSGNKPEETEVLCTMKKFQDGRSFPLEQGSRKKYYLQTGPQGCLFFSSSSQGLSNLLIGGGGGEKLYQFLCLCLGLPSATRIFTELYKAY